MPCHAKQTTQPATIYFSEKSQPTKEPSSRKQFVEMGWGQKGKLNSELSPLDEDKEAEGKF